MKFLDGMKTYLGAAGIVVSLLAQHSETLPASWAPYLQLAEGAFTMLASLGVIHKLEKARDAGSGARAGGDRA